MYADFVVLQTEISRNIEVLETGAGPNFAHDAQLSYRDVKRKIRLKPKISDENGHLLKISGTIALFLRYGSYVV